MKHGKNNFPFKKTEKSPLKILSVDRGHVGQYETPEPEPVQPTNFINRSRRRPRVNRVSYTPFTDLQNKMFRYGNKIKLAERTQKYLSANPTMKRGNVTDGSGNIIRTAAEQSAYEQNLIRDFGVGGSKYNEYQAWKATLKKGDFGYNS